MWGIQRSKAAGSCNEDSGESVEENRIRGLVRIDDMQFGFMPGKGTTHALFLVRRMQEEFRGREKKLYMCFADLEKAFDKVPTKVMEWALRKKALAEVLVQATMSLYEGSKTNSGAPRG